MNPSATLITTHSLPVSHYLRPATMARTFWEHRDLIRQLTWRNVVSKYRGSSFGVAWSFLLPLMMLVIYTFVFGVVLQARWPNVNRDSMAGVALTLYAGLLIYAAFAETLGTAPLLVSGNPNYVKKVVFPLEILPLCALGAALFQMLVSALVLLACSVIFTWSLSPTLYWFPLLLPSMAMLTLGLAWFLASLGVYLRDIGQFIGVVLQVMMFLTPIFYSLEQVPESFRAVMVLNPLTVLVEGARRTLLWGQHLEWVPLLWVTLFSALVMQLGYVWFMKTRRGFADVL